MTEFAKEVALAGRLSLPDSHTSTPIDFRRAAHGVRLYSPFKIHFSMKEQAQNALRYPKDDPSLETVCISSPLGTALPSVAEGAALTVLLHSPPTLRNAHPFPGRMKRKLQLGTRPHGILYINWSDCNSTSSAVRTSKTVPVKLTALTRGFFLAQAIP